ncbi:MAG: bifunctional (p)ppGpp synthetase/guanosine-3',5'-bis(diphosphate) 3'-pyrophosphohydrolase [Candidatus Eisenbacteria sp.]|nr:bifunctional (p)ppGpp synthetase/guanosine-3',5'-bis(diphosphate) 3'-pyrophosphohydrolase [Candidatus Eisenbacteria bacterium]
MTVPPPAQTDSFLEWLSKNAPYARDDLVQRAVKFARDAHDGQERRSGDPYVVHCVEVAKILARLRLDPTTIAAGLLHDVVEDTPVTLDELGEQFGEEIRNLVDGVTRISGFSVRSRERRQIENYRKMLLSMATDIRVILIKLADRLHNMRTLEFLDPPDRRRIARQTADVYAPLAHRFGIGRIKWELEDLSFKYLEPDLYREIADRVALSLEEREAYVAEVLLPVRQALEEQGIQAEIQGRPKHFFSIYRKMTGRDVPFEEMYDLFAIRVVCDTVPQCYHALGVIHTLFRPVHERIKDYIATPKMNMYQSLHTTIVGPRKRVVEFQIRTHEMHRTADYGIAAHWRYKEGKGDRELDEQMQWLRQVLEWQKDLTDPKEFMDFLKMDLFHDEVFVFTPKGELKRVPKGSTPIDFAFAVHTEVGLHCAGAKVNGRMVSLKRELRSGDTVEVSVSPSARPSRDWLKMARTPRARSKIRRWLRIEGLEHSATQGRRALEDMFRKRRLAKPSSAELHALAGKMGYEDLRNLYGSIGAGDLTARHVVDCIYGREEKPKRVVAATGARDPSQARGVCVEGADSVLVRFANCCQPVPGEPIVGYITRGRGITIHRVGCHNTFQMLKEPERRIGAEWAPGATDRYPVGIVVAGNDRPNLLADLSKAISDLETNMISVSISGDQATFEGRFLVEVKSAKHLKRVLEAASGVKGVTRVRRV